MNDADTPFDTLVEPPRYPAPDYDGAVSAVDILVPESTEPVGTLVVQGDSLDWLSSIAADHPGAALREWVAAYIREAAKVGAPALEAWQAILAVTQHTAPRAVTLAAPPAPEPEPAPQRKPRARRRKTTV